MWIVMTASAQMPARCKGRYRKIALVQLSQHYTAHGLRPHAISHHARGVLRIVQLGSHHVGLTDRCAYARALARAEEMCADLNNTPSVMAGDDLLMTLGGSA
jgi:hypothetical protein